MSPRQPTLERGHVVFQTDFEGAEALKGWSAGGTLAPGHDGGQSLCIERPAGSPHGSAMVRMPLPVEEVRGYLLYFSGMVKAEHVSEKPKPWNGVKFMVPIVTKEGKHWPQGNHPEYGQIESQGYLAEQQGQREQ